MQGLVQARVVEAVSNRCSDGHAIPSERSAFLELTKGRGFYGESANVNLAIFSSISRVSLPSTLEGSPYLADVVPDCAAHHLESQELMLRPATEVDALENSPVP